VRGQAESRDSSDRIAPGNQESAQPCPAPHWPARWKPIEVASCSGALSGRGQARPQSAVAKSRIASFLALDDLQDLSALTFVNLNRSAGPAQSISLIRVSRPSQMDALIRELAKLPAVVTWCIAPSRILCDFDARANSVSVLLTRSSEAESNCCCSLWCVEQFGTITNGGYNHINLASLLRSPTHTTMSGTNLHIRPASCLHHGMSIGHYGTRRLPACSVAGRHRRSH